MNNDACLVCKHVLKDVNQVGFVCHSGFGWSAACSEQCLDQHSEHELGMIHLGHVFAADVVDESVACLPKGFASDRSGRHWKERYFQDEYEPAEGDFVAPPKGSLVLELDESQVVFAYRQSSLEQSDLVWLRLEEGMHCVPFWTTRTDAEQFGVHLSGNEALHATTFRRLSISALESRVRYLAPDFLLHPYDFAILARA